MSRKKIRLPSGLELVRRHISAIRWETADKCVWVYMHASGTFPIYAADIAPFRAWWDAPKAKRVKADATGFIRTDVCVCGHNWGGHNLLAVGADACGMCNCNVFRLATPESTADERHAQLTKDCGCVTCICEHPSQCQGCGARRCYEHRTPDHEQNP